MKFQIVRTKVPCTAAGERIYAVGDVHGCYGLLHELLFQRIQAHADALPRASSTKLILVGDIIDRGPDSARVIEFLFNLQRRVSNVVVLIGNHEDAMIKALDGSAEVLAMWLRVGGEATLRSFGIDPSSFEDDPFRLIDLARQTIPFEWLAWLRSLPLTAQSGDYFFCHAGIRPGVRLKKQTRGDLLWIRDEFLDHKAWRGPTVVHGHTIFDAVEVGPRRIGIDTGAYLTGKLSALYLEQEQCEVVAVDRMLMRSKGA
jgi:serine/threonine protein phosphatase 1